MGEQVALGVKGFKFHPSVQGFEPNDRRYYPIYEAIAGAGLPALFHTGQTGLGSGLPGGHGIKMRYSDPVLLDDVAADFPDLTIVMAHPAVPWVDAQIAIVAHKANVYLDLSGYSPKYFPPQLVRALGRQLRTKALFGTDYPYVQLDRWKNDFAALDLDPELAPLIFKENALRVLGLRTAVTFSPKPSSLSLTRPVSSAGYGLDATPRPERPAGGRRRPVTGDHLDVVPPSFVHLAKAFDVPPVLDLVGAVLFAVVLDGDHDVLPPHVEVGELVADVIGNRDLRLGPWVSGVDQ